MLEYSVQPIESYENAEIIQYVDEVAKRIVAEKGKKYEDEFELGVIARYVFLPTFITAMNYKVCVEIGVDEATLSKKLLKSNLEVLYCVDTWQDDFGSNIKPGSFFDKDGNIRLKKALNNLGDNYKKGRAIPLQMTSIEAASKFSDESIDFLYVDGDHTLEGVYSDLKTWFPKVKVGGVLAGHDFKDGMNSGMTGYFGDQLFFRVKTAVTEYVHRYGHAVRQVGLEIKNWWFVKNRTY